MSLNSDEAPLNIHTEDDILLSVTTDGVISGGCRVHLAEPYNSLSTFLTPDEARQLEDVLREISERAETEARESR